MSRRSRIAVVAVLGALAVASCSKKPVTEDSDPAAEQKAAAERARQGPYGGDLKALDKAKELGADINRKAQEEGERADAMSK